MSLVIKVRTTPRRMCKYRIKKFVMRIISV